MGSKTESKTRHGWLAAYMTAATSMLAASSEAMSDASSVPATNEALGCGSGRVFLGHLVAFEDSVDFTIRIDSDRGYLLDCVAGADAYLEFQYSWDGSFVYSAWGQLGEYG